MFSVGIKFNMAAHAVDPSSITPWPALNLPAAVGDSVLTVSSRTYTRLLLYVKVPTSVSDVKPSEIILNQLGMGEIG